MALFNWFCTCIFFLLVSEIHVRAQNPDCYASKTTLAIEENNPPGLVIANITTAPDVTVTIDPTFQDHDWFEINGTQLILKYSVDYENTTVLIVNLQCLRGGMEIDDLLITVTVDNLNDNPPVFRETNITVNVNEDTKVNTTIVPQANVTATDADADVISYSLTGSPPEAMEYFNIQGVNNPQIFLQKVLDYEKIKFTELILYAMDGNASAPGTHTASATINIHVIPADLRPPWFQPCTFITGGKACINLGYTGSVNISEIATEPLILQPGPLYAIDGDKHLNEKIVYELVEGNDDDTFSINIDTGNITMKKPVNTLKTFMLHVMASQVNDPFKYAQTTVQIKVVYKNDHKPYFEKTNYTGTVSVGLPVPSPVMESGTLSTPLKIFAADKDFTDEINPNIEYKIQNSTDFSVTADGFLLTAKVLKLASTITLLAIANDKEAQQEASTLIIVDVTPLASTTNLPTTVTTTTTTTATTTTTVIPSIGTTISKPSSSSTHLSPAINNTVPTIPPGLTKSTTPLVSTTRNAAITGITGKPVTSTKPSSNIPPLVTTVKPPIITANASSQTTNSHMTGISQTTIGTVKSTIQTPSQSGATKPSITGITTMATVISTIQTISPTSSWTGTTNPSLPSGSPATNSTGQATATTSSQFGTTIPGITTTTVQSTAPMSPQSKTTEPSATSVSSGTAQSTNDPTSKSTTGITPVTTPTSSTPSTQKTEPHRTSAPETSPTSVTTGASNMYSAEDMAALGATLGCLLAITLVLLGFISYKHYKQKMKHKHGEDHSNSFEGYTNNNYQEDKKPSPDEKGDMSQASVVSENEDYTVTQGRQGTPPPVGKAMESSQASAASDDLEEGEENDEETDSEKEVRSILTKDRKVADDGYKAVWFKEDIDPEAKDDVVMIEEDNDVERNRDESDGENEDGDRDDDVRDSDDNDESDGDGDKNNSGQGSSDVSFIPGRPWISRSDPIASQSHEDTEENDIYF